MLEIENLHFSIGGKPVLKGVSASFAKGEIHGVIGPNGAGKSTLLKNICGIWRPTLGKIVIDGKDCRNMTRRELSRTVTMAPQNTRISFPISVHDIVSMGRHPHLGRFQSLSGQDRLIVEKALKICRIWPLRDRPVNELSGGESQLAIIARSLATEADLVLLDEPTSDLDIHHALAVMDLLARLKSEGKTIVVNLHDLNLASRYCDTVSIVREGEIFFKGCPGHAFSEQNVRTVFVVRMTEIGRDPVKMLYFSKDTTENGD